MIILTLTANIIFFGLIALSVKAYRRTEPVSENEYDPSKDIMFISIGFALLNIIALMIVLI